MSSFCTGFIPHAVRPTRCRRCFRDYSEHKKNNDASKNKSNDSSSISAYITVPLPRRRRESTDNDEPTKNEITETKIEEKPSNREGAKSPGIPASIPVNNIQDTKSPPQLPSKTLNRDFSKPPLAPSTPTREATKSPSILSSLLNRESTKSPVPASKVNSEPVKVPSAPSPTPPTPTPSPPVPPLAIYRRVRPKPPEETNSDSSTTSKGQNASEKEEKTTSSLIERRNRFRRFGSRESLHRSEPDGAASERSEESDKDSDSTKADIAKRIQIIAAKEVDRNAPAASGNSVGSTSPDVEFILRVKTTVNTQKEPDTESATTEGTITNQEAMDELQATITSLKKQLEANEQKCKKLEKEKSDLAKKPLTSAKDESMINSLKRQLEAHEEKCKKLEKEKTELSKKTATLTKEKEASDKTQAELSKMKTKLNQLQTTTDELKDENKTLKQEKKELQKDLSKKETTDRSKETLDVTRKKLQQAERLCQELMEENEEIKKEVRDLEEELEELHDNFREDQASEFRDLKKELESNSKNCRVLQFKLRKSERRCEQLELERHTLEEKMRDMHATSKIDVDKKKMRELENDLNVSRNMSRKMQSEIDSLKEALKKVEEEKDSLRKYGGKGGPTLHKETFPQLKGGLAGKDYESIVHELYDVMERENDLREQMKFSEDEARTMRRKLSSLEQENETLVMQMKKLTTVVRARSEKKKKDDDSSEEEDLSPEDLKIQMDLVEQEMGVMRRKVEELEHEKENLQSEVKYLQDKLINQPLTTIDLPEPPKFKDGSDPNIYYEHKVKLLEYEAREMRKKLIDKERDNERLQTEVEVHRRKASKVMVRSRSLDSELQVDLKRQLQLVEQEAGILRQKVTDLENENEKLNSENKRLNLRVSRKPPPGPADLLQLENLELKVKIEDLERKLELVKEELEKGGTGGSSTSTVINEYRPRREALSEHESDLINTLKKQMKSKEDENSMLQNKIVALEIENNRLNREFKKLKDNLNYKKKAPKVVRDNATRMELREVVNELQDEISELQVTLRGRESVQESIEEEMTKTKRELESLQKELQIKEDRVRSEVERLREQNTLLRQGSSSEREKAEGLQQQLAMLANQRGTKVDTINQLAAIKQEKENSDKRWRAAEDALEKKSSRLKELQDKLSTTTNLKDDLIKSNKMLETQKNDLQREIEDQKELLKKAQERASELQFKLESSGHDVMALRKECNQLRNEMEDEKSKIKHSGIHQSEVSMGWLKERDDIRKQLAEARNKADTMQQEIHQQEKLFHEKEMRLKEDHKKKRDVAVREAREKAEAEIRSIRDEEKITKTKLLDVMEKIEKAETALKEAAEKHRQTTNQLRKEKEEWHSTQSDLENQVRIETKKRERMEREHDQMLRMKDEDLLSSRDKVVQMEREQRKSQNKISNLEEKANRVTQLEKELDREKKEYEDMTQKYEELEKDFLKVKAKLINEKEQVEGSLGLLRRDYDHSKAELKSLRDSYGTKQDNWIKEKLDLQERIKEVENKLLRMAGWEQEKAQLKNTVDEKDSLIESYKKEERHLKDERERQRKRIEELSKKITDMERQERVGRTIALTGRQESHVDLRIKLDHSEQAHKADQAALKDEYEGRMRLMASEMSSMQDQIAALVKERDEYMEKATGIDNASDTGTLKREKARHREEADSAKRKVERLKKELEEMREVLDDNTLENKNLKLQYETDKNSWDIQVSELKSKINQLEEQKLLEATRGSTRSYAKTRLELAWEKERNDMQRILTESQQLIQDLKTKVQSLESDQDKEKQYTRRQLSDVRTSYDKESQDSRRRMSELHSDLIEVREHHAKLRGQFERVRQEREILMRDREGWKRKMQAMQEINAKTTTLLEQLNKLKTVVKPGEKPTTQNGPTSDNEIKEIIDEVTAQTEELSKVTAALKEEERVRRTASFRRAVSAQEVNQPMKNNDPGQRWMNPQRVTNYPLAPPSMIIRPPPRQKSLNRKSLSLDHTLGAADLQKIWDSGGEESNVTTPSGSLLSLRMSRFGGSSAYGYESDTSLPDSEIRYGPVVPYRRSRGAVTDSEPESLSGSVENVPVFTKPKKSLKDKLLQLTRSRSIDITAENAPVDKEEKEKSLRSKISKVLRKPLGRSTSSIPASIRLERIPDDPSLPRLPPRGHPETIPERPKTEKPILSSKGDQGSRQSLLEKISSEKRTRSRPVEDLKTATLPRQRKPITKQTSLPESMV